MGVDRIFADAGDSWVSKPRRRTTYWLIGITAGFFFLLAIIRGLSPSAALNTQEFLSNWLIVSADGLLSGRVWQLLTHAISRTYYSARTQSGRACASSESRSRRI